MWATQPHNEEKLNEAYATSDDVVLVFSVNGSGHFQGYARMAGPIKQEKAAIWEGDANVGGPFRVEWVQRVDLPHGETDHLRRAGPECKPALFFEARGLAPEVVRGAGAAASWIM